jgi:hypothetical protein
LYPKRFLISRWLRGLLLLTQVIVGVAVPWAHANDGARAADIAHLHAQADQDCAPVHDEGNCVVCRHLQAPQLAVVATFTDSFPVIAQFSFSNATTVAATPDLSGTRSARPPPQV